MAYCWAALRTLGILIGVVVGLLFLTAIASGVFNAFLYTFGAGYLALALVFSVLALFGHQLVRLSKTVRTQRIGRLTRNCSASAAILALASFAVDYGYSAIENSRTAAVHGPWERYAARKPDGPTPATTNPFDKFDTPAQRRGTTAGMFDDLIPKRAGARTDETTPNCDDELVAAYRASQTEAAAVPPPPPGFVLDGPASRTLVVTTRPCLAVGAFLTTRLAR